MVKSCPSYGQGGDACNIHADKGLRDPNTEEAFKSHTKQISPPARRASFHLTRVTEPLRNSSDISSKRALMQSQTAICYNDRTGQILILDFQALVPLSLHLVYSAVALRLIIDHSKSSTAIANNVSELSIRNDHSPSSNPFLALTSTSTS